MEEEEKRNERKNTHAHTHTQVRGNEKKWIRVIFLVRSGGDRMVDKHLHQPINEDISICDWANRWLPHPL